MELSSLIAVTPDDGRYGDTVARFALFSANLVC